MPDELRRGDRVVLLLPKSPTAVISLLAVLKAGGIYVPLDPANPAARYRASQRCTERIGTPAARATSDNGIPSLMCDRSTAKRAMACWRCSSVKAARAGATPG